MLKSAALAAPPIERAKGEEFGSATRSTVLMASISLHSRTCVNEISIYANCESSVGRRWRGKILAHFTIVEPKFRRETTSTRIALPPRSSNDFLFALNYGLRIFHYRRFIIEFLRRARVLAEAVKWQTRRCAERPLKLILSSRRAKCVRNLLKLCLPLRHFQFRVRGGPAGHDVERSGEKFRSGLHQPINICKNAGSGREVRRPQLLSEVKGTQGDVSRRENAFTAGNATLSLFYARVQHRST